MPRRVPRETTQHGVELVDVSGPYGTPDRVLRRPDSLVQLRGSGIIGDREMRAAERYRTAWHTVRGSGMPCGLATSPSVPAPASRTPTQQALEAAGIIGESRRLLGQADVDVLRLVVVEGYSIGDVAIAYFTGHRDRTHVGHRLRWALLQLADFWFGIETQRRNYVHREHDARPQAGAIAELVPSKVAHASRKGVSY